MRVLVTGSREWTDRGVIRHALETLPRDTVIIHGAARGVDRIAGEIATELGFMVEPYPADWGTYGRKAAGPIRNRQMLVEGKPDVVYAFHDDLWKKSKGTKNMANQALHAGGAGHPVLNVCPAYTARAAARYAGLRSRQRRDQLAY